MVVIVKTVITINFCYNFLLQGTGTLTLSDEMKKAGVKIVTIDGIEYYGFSNPINKMVEKNEREAVKHKDDLDMDLKWFADMVETFLVITMS